MQYQVMVLYPGFITWQHIGSPCGWAEAIETSAFLVSRYFKDPVLKYTVVEVVEVR